MKFRISEGAAGLELLLEEQKRNFLRQNAATMPPEQWFELYVKP